jgi:exopolysaccharide production protein ExoZ
MRNRKLKLIQVFRGCAAILVLLFHITTNVKVIFPGKEFLFGIFKFGASGVDFFFVLSGFIIAYSSLNLVQSGKFWQYTAHRLIRIYPIYWIIFIVYLLPHIFFPQFYGTIYSLNWKNILPAILLLPYHNMINGVSWTLSFELYFYLMFLAIFCIKNIRLSAILIIIYALITIVCGNMRGLYSFFVSPLILEFFLGILIYFIFKPVFFKSKGLYFILLGLLLFILSGYLTNNDYTLFSSDLNRVVLFGLPSFLIILGAVVYDTNKDIKINGFLLSVGDASYSLYLIHLPIVVFALKVLSKKASINILSLNLVLLLLFIFIIIISLIIHKFIEKRITKFLKSQV